MDTLYNGSEITFTNAKFKCPVNWMIEHEVVNEHIIESSMLIDFPEWTRKLLEDGGDFDQLEFADGTTVTRLRNKRKLVVGSQIDRPQS